MDSDSTFDRRKFCSMQHVGVMVSTFSGFKLIGVMNMRNQFDRIPKAFSTILRARLRQKHVFLVSSCFDCMASLYTLSMEKHHQLLTHRERVARYQVDSLGLGC